MRFLIPALASFVLTGVAASSAHATLYDFSDSITTNGTTTSVAGSFNGTASGNLITNLSNISVSVDGTAFNGSGALSNITIDATGGFTTGGYASFDGTQNNFIFVDVDSTGNNWTNYYYSIAGVGAYVDIVNPSLYVGYSASTPSAWTVAEAPVPEPASIVLLGSGLVGLVGLSLRKIMRAT